MIPLYTTKQVREADKYAIEKCSIPGAILMENAARSIFEIIESYLAGEAAIKIGIICGKGNNGGDGFALARHFLNFNYPVTVITAGTEKELKGDALLNYIILKKLALSGKNLSIIAYKGNNSLTPLKGCPVIVDALLGTGAKGILKEPFKSIIEYANKLNSYRIAVDIPTGLDADTGEGDTIFNADLTVSLCELKTGLFYGKGYVNCGKVEKGYIGIGEEYFNNITVKDYLIEPEDAFNYLPDKSPDAYKYTAGKTLVIAGSGRFTGAALLTANAVMKSGAGACVLAFPESIKNSALRKLNVPTVLPYDDSGKEHLTVKSLNDLKEKIKWADSIAIGPGLGREPETLLAVQTIINENDKKHFVIDADALYALQNKKYNSINLKGKVLTPHQKEFADMLGITLEELRMDMLNKGKKFALKTGCNLVLKGAPTIIFNPKGEAFINSSGNPGMAKFGSGDVLTGFIAGIIAQSGKVEESIIPAVYIHSLSADLLLKKKTVYGMTSSDILENLPYAIKFICDTFTSVS